MATLGLDKRLEFSNNQKITVTAESEHVIDFGTERAASAGRMISLRIKEAFQGGTSLQVIVQDSADNSGFTDAVTTPAFVTAQLTVSSKEPFYTIALPSLRRYVRLKYQVSGTFTAGRLHAIMH